MPVEASIDVTDSMESFWTSDVGSTLSLEVRVLSEGVDLAV